MKNSLKLLLIALIAFLLFYTQMPVLQYGFISIGIIILILSIAFFLFSSSFKIENGGNKISLIKSVSWIKYVALASFVYITVLPFFTSTPILHSQKYQQLIGKVNVGKKISDHIN